MYICIYVLYIYVIYYILYILYVDEWFIKEFMFWFFSCWAGYCFRVPLSQNGSPSTCFDLMQFVHADGDKRRWQMNKFRETLGCVEMRDPQKSSKIMDDFRNILLLMAEILHQLRLVVYPIIYRVLYIPGGAGFQPSTVVLTRIFLLSNRNKTTSDTNHEILVGSWRDPVLISCYVHVFC